MKTSQRLKWALAGLAVAGLGGLLVMINAGPSPVSIAEVTAKFPADVQPIQFDRVRAMGYLKAICDLGPRISGSAGMRKQQELLQSHFEETGAKVEFQRFTAQQRSQTSRVQMANLIARWHPERGRRIILCAHYDTRPIADQEPNERDWEKPFLAANDGAAGPALMMELAHHMVGLDFKVGVDFILFDGEEYIFDNRQPEFGGDFYFFGSEHFAREYQQERRKNPRGPVYTAAVLVDLFAGKNAQYPYEGYSWANAGALCERVWKIAAEMNIRTFVPKVRDPVRDDHLALQRVGIPAIDIIDFGYRHWHRLTDVPENCSGESMENVGKVVAVWMQRAR